MVDHRHLYGGILEDIVAREVRGIYEKIHHLDDNARQALTDRLVVDLLGKAGLGQLHRFDVLGIILDSHPGRLLHRGRTVQCQIVHLLDAYPQLVIAITEIAVPRRQDVLRKKSTVARLRQRKNTVHLLAETIAIVPAPQPHHLSNVKKRVR